MLHDPPRIGLHDGIPLLPRSAGEVRVTALRRGKGVVVGQGYFGQLLLRHDLQGVYRAGGFPLGIQLGDVHAPHVVRLASVRYLQEAVKRYVPFVPIATAFVHVKPVFRVVRHFVGNIRIRTGLPRRERYRTWNQPRRKQRRKQRARSAAAERRRLSPTWSAAHPPAACRKRRALWSGPRGAFLAAGALRGAFFVETALPWPFPWSVIGCSHGVAPFAPDAPRFSARRTLCAADGFPALHDRDAVQRNACTNQADPPAARLWNPGRKPARLLAGACGSSPDFRARPAWKSAGFRQVPSGFRAAAQREYDRNPAKTRQQPSTNPTEIKRQCGEIATEAQQKRIGGAP